MLEHSEQNRKVICSRAAFLSSMPSMVAGDDMLANL